MEILLSPPLAFVINIVLVLLLLLVGRKMASHGEVSALKGSLYSSGEEAPAGTGVPGYRPFFLIAFFFAILHLGILVFGSGGFSPLTAIYLGGLIAALVALILG
jgi:NADH:ubiquinone oxidoreductase subunit 3 (subunit A)